MKRGKVWMLVLIVSVMTLTTVFYVTMVRNAKTSYANGKFVEWRNGEEGEKVISLSFGRGETETRREAGNTQKSA